ncbi:MAG TPA: LPS export ABC transporter ATP-binding protein [Armatimonadota bacterium]
MELATDHLRKTYRGRVAVDDVSFTVTQGEVVGLLGPNGAGKTTSFYMVVGLVRPNSGRVMLDGEDITHLPIYRRARAGIGYLAQENSVFRKLSVEDNLRLVLEMQALPPVEQKQRLERLLTELNLTSVRRQLGQTLSGGERRRVEIARTLATEPAFILLDEPFTGVDPIAVHDIQELVLHLKSRNIGVLITDHNVRETLAITDRAYIMDSGRILTSGVSEELVRDPVARERYLGERFRL